MRVCVLFPAYRTVILCCCFSSFGRLEDKPEIDNVFFFHPFARLRWLRMLEGGSCVACRALHFIELPCQTSFCIFFYIFFISLLSGGLAPCSRRCVCDSSSLLLELRLLVCNFVRPQFDAQLTHLCCFTL